MLEDGAESKPFSEIFLIRGVEDERGTGSGLQVPPGEERAGVCGDASLLVLTCARARGFGERRIAVLEVEVEVEGVRLDSKAARAARKLIGSAPSTLDMVDKLGVEPKPFAFGVRY